MAKRILNTKEAAEYLGISIETLYKYLANPELRDKLGAYKSIGGRGTMHSWKFNIRTLKLFLQGDSQQYAGTEQANTGRVNK